MKETFMNCALQPMGPSLLARMVAGLKKVANVVARVLTCVIIVGLTATVSQASISASLDISYQAEAGGVYDYTLTLKNSAASTSAIKEFWFAWLPGLDFMVTNPISVTPPSGWSPFVEAGAYYGGYSIQFTTSTSPINPGQTLPFQFTSFVTPAELAGNSPVFFNYYPESFSYVYSDIPETGDASTLTGNVVPEPSTLSLVGLGIAAAAVGLRCRKLRFVNLK